MAKQRNDRKVKSLDISTLVVYHTAISVVLKYNKNNPEIKARYDANVTSSIFTNIDTPAFVDLTLQLHSDLQEIVNNLLENYNLFLTYKEYILNKFQTTYVVCINGLTDNGSVLTSNPVDSKIGATLSAILIIEQNL